MEEIYGELIEEGGTEEEKTNIVKRIINWLRKMFASIRERIKKFFSKQSPEDLQEEVVVDKSAWDKTISFLANVKKFLSMNVKAVLTQLKERKLASLITLITGFAITGILVKDHKINKARKIKKQEFANAIKDCDDLIMRAKEDIDRFDDIYDREMKNMNRESPQGKKGLFGRQKPPTKAELDKYETMKTISETRANKAMEGIRKEKESIKEYANQRKELEKATGFIPEPNYSTFVQIYRTIISSLDQLITKLTNAMKTKAVKEDKEN